MAAIRSNINPYRGVNPHIDSRVSWKEFHARHIASLDVMLGDFLEPLGYYVVRETGDIQVRKYGALFQPASRARSLGPDISIRRQREAQMTASQVTHAPAARPGAITIPIMDLFSLDEEEYIEALSIYRLESNPDGLPAAWIELLSPANKPGGSRHQKYYDKRFMLIDAGVPLVEIDYLHDRSSDQKGLVQYPEAGAFPFNIYVYEMRLEGKTFDETVVLYPFAVEQPIPEIFIPFRRGEAISGVTFDFDAAYADTIHHHYRRRLDYSTLPDTFDTFREDDQRAIQARLYTIRIAAAQGLDLNAGILPLACTPEEAPARLAELA